MNNFSQVNFKQMSMVDLHGYSLWKKFLFLQRHITHWNFGHDFLERVGQALLDIAEGCSSYTGPPILKQTELQHKDCPLVNHSVISAHFTGTVV